MPFAGAAPAIGIENWSNMTSINTMDTRTNINVFPNPFNYQIRISFEIINAGITTLEILDTNGKVIRILINQQYLT